MAWIIGEERTAPFKKKKTDNVLFLGDVRCAFGNEIRSSILNYFNAFDTIVYLTGSCSLPHHTSHYMPLGPLLSLSYCLLLFYNLPFVTESICLSGTS